MSKSNKTPKNQIVIQDGNFRKLLLDWFDKLPANSKIAALILRELSLDFDSGGDKKARLADEIGEKLEKAVLSGAAASSKDIQHIMFAKGMLTGISARY